MTTLFLDSIACKKSQLLEREREGSTYRSLNEFISIGGGADGEGRRRAADGGGGHRMLAEEGLSLDEVRLVKNW